LTRKLALSTRNNKSIGSHSDITLNNEYKHENIVLKIEMESLKQQINLIKDD